MVGYNRIPTQRLRADARFPRGAGQAKRRQLAASGDLTPSASHRSLHPHHYSPHRRSPVTPLPPPGRPLVPQAPPRALSSCRSVVRSPPPLSPRALPADSTAHTHSTQATSSFPLGELRLVRLSLPLRPLRAPSLPPLAGPRKRGIASNSNYRTRGYHASNLTLGRPTRARASRAAPRTFFRGRFFTRRARK